MARASERHFLHCLKKHIPQRTADDLDIIYAYLRGLEALSSLREPALRAICKNVRYEFHDANDILYCRGEISSCWYILLTGSVFIDGSMFLPRSSFGKRTAGCARRPNECLILEPSEMIVIDYPDVQLMKAGQGRQPACPVPNMEKYMSLEGSDEYKMGRGRGNMAEGPLDQLPQELQGVQNVLQRSEQYMRSEQYFKRSSRASDTSSAYSGSDMMQSSIDDQDIDLSGLVESIVDSDDEEGYAESTESMPIRDAVRECLEKDPSERNDDDIEILLEFMQHFPAFANMTLATRRSLCSVMVFAVVEKAGTIVMHDAEELDSWSVIINGQVEITLPDDTVEQLQMGDSFGITPTMEKLYHKGVMRTTQDDCQFVCIAQSDYYRILHQGEENTHKFEEKGQVVMVTEDRVLDAGNRKGSIVIRGTPERLMTHLVEEHSVVDPTYVEDFLLTYRTFIESPLEVANRLLMWFGDAELRDRVTRVVLLWVNNHFNDFESNPAMSEFLEKFEIMLERERMIGQLRLLNIACSAKARARTITLTRSTKDEILHFSVLGGLERHCGIFISKVEKGTKAHEAGLRRGDQILEVNGHNFEFITHNRALEILRGTTHLSISVKSNVIAFKEMLYSSSPGRPAKKQQIAQLQPDFTQKRQGSVPELDLGVPPVISPVKPKKGDKKEKPYGTVGKNAKLRKALNKINLLPKQNSDSKLQHNHSDNDLTCPQRSRQSSTSSASSNTSAQQQQMSNSSPDISATILGSFAVMDDTRNDFPEHVLKVYRSDQSCKYFLVHRETTAREVVMLALREFGITDPSSNYSLCEVTVENEGFIKQKRLPEQLTNLPERINLNGRYYLKNNMSTETLVPDELASELMKEGQISFLQLKSIEIATQLTLEDFHIFANIEATEYIDDLFDLPSKYGTPNILQFQELVNREMFWVTTEVVRETNIIKRMKIIKHFIKIARHCKECKNFNSMFAILSGLGHGSVQRLRTTWDKLPNKYVKIYEDLQTIMDPSRNMAKYRNLINSELVQPPLIPLFPIVKKDLTFIHLGNDSKVDGLVNFEKLRMIAKEVRHLCLMASAPYDPNAMFLPGSSSASIFANNASGTNTIKKKTRRNSTLPNPKKMYEEYQMVRRVKNYLHSMKIVADEDELDGLSLQCEPQLPRKRDQSPPPPAPVNNAQLLNANLGPKFGAKSPDAVRKLLSLSEDKVRPHNPKHPTLKLNSPGNQRRLPLSPQPGRLKHTHLSPESSSVVSLSSIAMRKSHTSGSIGSADSSSPPTNHHHLYETDSGHNSIASSNFDSHSTSSVGSAHSPPSQRHLSNQHMAPHLQSSRPPLPPYHVVVQNSQGYHYLQQQQQYLQYHLRPHHRPPLPDYHAATQMAQLARQKQMISRSHSFEGVPGCYVEDDEDEGELVDDEEEQVSAV
ncbi:rap guanine nucleotide exchange factor 6 isoform X2 [Lingula anatina]|uniref:Rap guanine nucleotide exchange factor 6 isoform X2 n=1 Tax=Lingula anatina TaxID=7574 RepID=A0A1S3IP32_LINAN|nr:rap guanine nucleotide exchange factor 6 isoform X2 [Lingula anatina]|eukprot:XP_013399838.1 rap guanine nucleotide exchange factor 6 isoform X2 [Lingula anatina]